MAGGGTCIYVKNVFKVTPLEISIDKPVGVEDVWLTVQSRKLPSIVIGCLYRHPKAPVETYDYIHDVFSLTCLTKKKFYVMGDFNDDVLMKNSNLNKILTATKLSQVIDKPTRTTDHSATLLDVIVTNNPHSILQYDVVPCPIADHDLITATVNLKKPPRQAPQVKTSRHLTGYSPIAFCDLLINESYKLTQIFHTDNVDTQVNIFTDTFNQCLNTCAPLVTKVVRRPFAPWINDSIEAAIGHRNEIQRKLKENT